MAVRCTWSAALAIPRHRMRRRPRLTLPCAEDLLDAASHPVDGAVPVGQPPLGLGLRLRGAAWTTDRRASIGDQSISLAISSSDDPFADASNSVS